MGNTGFTGNSGDTGKSQDTGKLDLSRNSNNGRFKDISSSNSPIIFPEAKTYSQQQVVDGASIHALKLHKYSLASSPWQAQAPCLQ